MQPEIKEGIIAMQQIAYPRSLVIEKSDQPVLVNAIHFNRSYFKGSAHAGHHYGLFLTYTASDEITMTAADIRNSG